MAAVVCFEVLGEDDTEHARQAAHDGQWLACAACARPVAPLDARVAVNGSHEHRFVNPHGIAFRIGCFEQAPGCAAHGPPTQAWSWFEGFAWQAAGCRGCATHLGWRFGPTGSGGSAFHGLILDRLIARSGAA